MKYITTIITKIRGYKTFTACAALVVYAIAGFATGKIDGATATQCIIEAAAIAGLRAAK